VNDQSISPKNRVHTNIFETLRSSNTQFHRLQCCCRSTTSDITEVTPAALRRLHNVIATCSLRRDSIATGHLRCKRWTRCICILYSYSHSFWFEKKTGIEVDLCTKRLSISLSLSLVICLDLARVYSFVNSMCTLRTWSTSTT